jgi:hypothetical protein
MFIALAIAAAAAASAPAPVPPAFAAYKAACLDTQADPATVRALAVAQKWGPLSAEDKDAIAPGNADNVEGWSIGHGAGRLRVSITSGALKGGLEQGLQSTCTLSAAHGDDEAFVRAYSEQLKRKPGDSSSDGGIRTAVWSVYAGEARAMHYYFGGADPGAVKSSTLSVTVLKK